MTNNRTLWLIQGRQLPVIFVASTKYIHIQNINDNNERICLIRMTFQKKNMRKHLFSISHGFNRLCMYDCAHNFQTISLDSYISADVQNLYFPFTLF